MEWFNAQWVWDNMSSILITVLFGGLLTTLIALVRKSINDVKAMKTYMRVKGVDDFCFDCERWINKGHITTWAYASLKSRYEALEDLGADGERDVHWRLIEKLVDEGKIVNHELEK